MGLKEVAQAARRKWRPVHCPHCGHESVQFEGSSYDCENCTIGVPPALNRVGPPGYDLKAARNKRDAALDRWWMGAALLTMLLLGRFVTAHDFDRFAETALALVLGWVIGQLFRGPDKR